MSIETIAQIQLPIALTPEGSILINDLMSRRYLSNILVDTKRGRDKIITQIVAQTLGIKPPLYPGESQEGLGFRGKGKCLAVIGIIEGLYAYPVPGKKQLPFLPIPDGKSEHPRKTLHTPFCPFLIEMDQHL